MFTASDLARIIDEQKDTTAGPFEYMTAHGVSVPVIDELMSQPAQSVLEAPQAIFFAGVTLGIGIAQEEAKKNGAPA